MKVSLEDYGMSVTSETGFEEQWLKQNFDTPGKIRIFLKQDSDVTHLKIFTEESFANK